MKLAVSSTGQNIDSPIDPRFGRCMNFLIVDSETMSSTIVPNSSVNTAHGAGIGAAQNVASLGVKAIITGHVGPNAHKALSGAGIEIYTVPSGTVKEAVEKFNNGLLSKVQGPTVSGHFGQGRGRGRGYRTR
jgi:predicted Fe-Mo cluster-binding NifX family protein